ncbi:MAG: late competence development ComFB family protein [Spirochaetales bacterium]|nr:late competence development ComFB family protein [Spirochaetales bacterium]
MEIYNLTMEMVTSIVEDIFNDTDYIKKSGGIVSDEYKADIICFVLNRIPPAYTTSSRGLSHLSNTVFDKPQRNADIRALVYEAIRNLSGRRQNNSIRYEDFLPEPPLFNFPVIKGKVMYGKTFAPYSGSSIVLKINGIPALMNGDKWQNPCPLIEETEGHFIFWPIPLKADKSEEKKQFSIGLELQAEGYKPINHYIDLELTSEDKIDIHNETTHFLKVDPIYLFSIDEPEEIIPPQK